MLVTWTDFSKLIYPDGTKPFRMGMVCPGGGCETDFYTFEKASTERVRLYLSNSIFGTVDGDNHHPNALRRTADIDWIVAAAKRLHPIKLDSLVWACASSDFIIDRKFALTQVRQIEEATNIPTTSTSLAFVAAMQALSVAQVSVLTNYPEPVMRYFTAFLEEHDINVIDVECLGYESGWMSAGITSSKLIEQAMANLDKRADALLIPDTALSAFATLKELEPRFSKPILTANLVSIWHGLHIGKHELSMPEFGPLFKLRQETSPYRYFWF